MNTAKNQRLKVKEANQKKRYMNTRTLKCILLIAFSVLCTLSAVAQKNLQLGQMFRDCPDCPEMVVIPEGSFMMGSPENEEGRISPEEGPAEGPQRLVNIRSFAAGKFDITKAEWAKFVKDTDRPITGGCGFSMLPSDSLEMWEPNPDANWDHLGFEQDGNHPVVCITWNDTQDYVQWLSKKTGATYRLLTEAEWEYAARAGTTTPYSWGTTASHEHANYGDDKTDGIGIVSGRDQWMYTSPVGLFPPNQFGLYDMSGNVWQWVEDYLSISYENLPTDGSAYQKEVLFANLPGNFSMMNGLKSSDTRMVRGGSALDSPRLLRSATRNTGILPAVMVPDFCRSAGGGFRVARTL